MARRETQWFNVRVLALTLACTACGTESSSLELVALDIDRAPISLETPAVLSGRGFFEAASVDLNTSEAALDASFQVLIGTRELAAEATSRVDSNTLNLVLPAGLPGGLHDLTVIAPNGSSDVLEGALLVADPELQLDDAADGSGDPIGTRQVAVGSDFPLFAVSRWPDGVFFRAEEVSWATVGSSGTFTEMTSSSVFSPTGIGSTTITAESALFGSASAEIETAGCSDVSDCVDDPCRSESCPAGLCVVGAIDKDTDGDSFLDSACGGDDCDDDDILEHPGQLWYPDSDSDLFGDSSATPNSCERLATTDVLDGTDCNDASNLSSPGIFEGPIGTATCNDTIDNDCDNATDGADSGCVAQLFTTPVLVSELSASGFDDVAPTATGDLLEVFFESDRGGGAGGADIWTSTRASIMDPWGTPSNVAELNTLDREVSPSVSSDGLRMTFSSDRPGSFDRDIWFSSRATRTSPWSAPTHEDVLSSVDKERRAPENSSGLLLVLDRQTLGTFDLFQRALIGEVWTFVRTLTELDSPGVVDDQAFLVGDNGLQIFFTSERAGGLGGSDIWTATRASTSSDFGTATNVSELNSTAIEEGVWVAPDLSYILFSSERTGEKNIYEAFLQ